MKLKDIVILGLFLITGIGLKAQTPNCSPTKIYEVNGYYFSDPKQTQFYTGDYREFYDNGTVKLEMRIKNGQPDGAHVIYFENRRPKEVRSYREGKLHGLWRTYDIAGQLISEANYVDGNKEGIWRIWDELGALRYEMSYTNNKKSGSWKMWDDKGNLVDEKKY